MNLIVILILIIITPFTLNSTIHSITNQGFSFSPSTITINIGDTVSFVLEPMHNAIEVSEATWSANGNTPNGGFSVPFGGGIFVPTEIKTYYYVCEPHASMGMKGRIIVNNPYPEIISVTPEFGPIGTIITIHGSGFSEVPTQNTVLLGVHELSIINASATQLDCVVPEGATTGEIKVIVNGMISPPPYTTFLVLPNKYDFLPGINNMAILDVTACDFDGDANDEILILGRLKEKGGIRGNVTLLKRTSNISNKNSIDVFTLPDIEIDSNYTFFSTRICADDCPSDYIAVFGKTKVTQGEKVNAFIILQHDDAPGSGESNFKIYRAVSSIQDRKVSRAIICDITGDDSIDVVFAYEPTGAMPGFIQIIKNIPGGGASSSPYESIGRIVPIGNAKCDDMEVGDVDGDGKADLVCATDKGIYVFKNNFPDFVLRQIIDNGNPYTKTLVCDINRDTFADIVGIRNDIGQLNVCIADSNSPGQFFSPEVIGTGVKANIAKCDVNGDGNLDIVCRSVFPVQSFSVFIVHDVSPGSGVVSTRINLSVCDSDSALFTIGRFDNDNYCDFAFSKCSSTNISPPLVSKISPDIGIAGTLFSIEGENLDNTISVHLGSNECDIIHSTSSELLVKWPNSSRNRGSTNLFDQVKVSSTNGVCFALKNIKVSPVYFYPVKEIGNLKSTFFDASDIDKDGLAEAISYNVKPTKYTNGHITLLKAFDDEGGSSERIVASTFPDQELKCEDVIIGDFNADGYPDIARFLNGTRGPLLDISFQSNLIRGTFSIEKRKADSLRYFERFVPGAYDLNSDGFNDMVYITRYPDDDRIVARLNNPSDPGDFSSIRVTSTGKRTRDVKYPPTSSISGFFDIVIVTPNEIDLYNYEAGGAFSHVRSIDIRDHSLKRSIEVCDLNNDGKYDFVVIDSSSNVVTICLNLDFPNFKVIEIIDSTSGSSSSNKFSPIVMDFDGDGKIDIGINESDVHNKTEPDVYVWKIKYNRTRSMDTVLVFEDSYISTVKSDTNITEIAVGDLDGDGISDMIARGIKIEKESPKLMYECSNHRPVAGSTIKINGYNISTTSSVRLYCDDCVNPIDLSFSVLSDSELSVIIPHQIGKKYIAVVNMNTTTWFTQPLIVLGAPDLFVSLPPDSLIITESSGKFKKPVKRGKGMPNWINLLEETVVQGGFQPGSSESDAAGGLVVGISHIFEAAPNKWKPIKDSALVRAWVAIRGWDWKKNVGKNWSAIQKSLKDKNFEHVGIARGLDSTGIPGDSKRKKLKGELKMLDPKKTSNKLFAEIVALKFNIAASQLGKTPVGFGELIYNDDSSMFDEMSILEISNVADSAMTYYTNPLYQGGGHEGINPLYEGLYRTIHKINRAFVGPLDTATFIVGNTLTLNGVVDISTVPYLKMPISFKPRILNPTTNLTESSEDYEVLEDVEALPTLAKLYQNYPNPFNPTTTISFSLKNSSIVTMKIYNLLGQEIITLMDAQEMSEGFYEIDFDANNLSSGIYIYRILIEEQLTKDGKLGSRYMDQKKMILLK